MINKKLILLGLFTVIIIAVFFMFYNLSWEEMEISFKKEVKEQKITYYLDINLDEIYLEDDMEAYSLKNGQVFRNGQKINSDLDKSTTERIMRLAYFYEWMRLDPLLFSATADLEKFSESIIRLKTEEAMIREEKDWSEKFYPIDFLTKFIEASYSFGLFNSEISESRAQDLLEKIAEVQEAYKEEAQNLKEKIDSFGGETKYLGLGGNTYTTFSIMSEDLSTMLANAELLRKEIEKRKKCLIESLEFCQLENKPAIVEAESLKTGEPPDLLTVEELNIPVDADYFGPFIINSPCWDKKTEQYLYTRVRCKNSQGYCFYWPHLADNVYFARLQTTAFDQYLINKEVERKTQSATAPYVCNNLEYQPKLATVSYFYQNYSNDRVFGKVKENIEFKKFSLEFQKLIEAGKQAEDSFFGSQFPAEDNLEQLSNYYLSVYNFLLHNQVASLIDKKEFLFRYLLIKEKFVNFDLLVNRIVYHLSSTFLRENTLEYERPININPRYMYSFRSHYSLLFLNFSPSVWRLNYKPQYLKTDYDIGEPDEKAIIDYYEAVDKYGRENILNWYKIYNETPTRKDL